MALDPSRKHSFRKSVTIYRKSAPDIYYKERYRKETLQLCGFGGKLPDFFHVDVGRLSRQSVVGCHLWCPTRWNYRSTEADRKKLEKASEFD